MSIFRHLTDCINDYAVFRGRDKDGRRDLTKALPKAKSISTEQKEEILDFWSPYLTDYYTRKAFDIRWFDVYNRTNVFNHTLKYYIPDSYYYGIIDSFFSDPRKSKVLDNKNYYDLFFYDAPLPKTIARKIAGIYLDNRYQIITEEEAITRCNDNNKVIFKKAFDSMGGNGISYWDNNRSSINDLKHSLHSKDNIVIQEVVRQHNVLASFNNSCVNTIRLVTLVLKGDVHLVTSVVIMGGKDAKTNHLHSGGLVCGIRASGQLMPVAFDGTLNQYETHPNGIRFEEVFLPSFDKCVDIVQELAPRFSGASNLISWDLTIDELGNPLIIETNLFWGGTVQIAGGPVFGELTKEVLDYVKHHRK